MEFQADPLEIEFSLDPASSSPSSLSHSLDMNLDSFIKSLSPEEIFGWDGGNLDQTSPLSEKPLEMDSFDFGKPTFEPLSVEPTENWMVDIKPEPDYQPNSPTEIPITTRTPIKREPRKPRKTGTRKSKVPKQQVDEKYLKRLEANKLSAQASRERKKQLKSTLEEQMGHLEAENKQLGTEITQLETENKVLKGEFMQLQNLITQSPILSKLMAQQISMNLPSVEEMELRRQQKIQELSNSTQQPLFTPSATTDPAAFMYLLIILQTFSQQFKHNVSDLRTMQLPMAPMTVM